MPIYEYSCEKCGAVTELLVLAGREAGPACEKRGGRELERQISTFATGGGPSEGCPPSCSGST